MAEPAVPLVMQQFARVPLPGAVKTRMLPALSAQAACLLHVELLRRTCSDLLASGLGPVELWLAGEGAHPVLAECLARGARGPYRQVGDDLGERMYRALADGLSRARSVLLVGSDCPQLDADYLRSAAQALRDHDCVLGPAADGGYVLIGARRVSAAWFRGIAWGGEGVYASTVRRLQDDGVAWVALPERRDIDRPEDLPWWRALRDGDSGAGASGA